MRKVFLFGLAVVLGSALSWAQEHSQPDSWKGKYEFYQFNLGEDKGLAFHDAFNWKSDYDLYQNRDGVARLELTHLNRNRLLEGPLDIQLLDYRQGVGWVWDKGGALAIKGPLGPPAEGKSLGTRQILGFTCEGKEYERTTFQQGKVQLQSWSARDTNFRFPLLRVSYHTTSTGVLSALIVQVVTQLEPVSDLPASLFEVPAGLRATAVRSIE
jgi:hypothetical protein